MNWSEVVISVVSVVLTAVASWGIAKLIELINSKISNTQATNILSSAVTIITDVVKQIYQTYVEALKDTNTFDADCQKEALCKALETAKALIPTATQTFIETTYGDFDVWLTTQIESIIYSLKTDNTVTIE